MKVLILGPKARYEAYMPEFVAQLPFETAYCSLDQSHNRRRGKTLMPRSCSPTPSWT